MATAVAGRVDVKSLPSCSHSARVVQCLALGIAVSIDDALVKLRIQCAVINPRIERVGGGKRPGCAFAAEDIGFHGHLRCRMPIEVTKGTVIQNTTVVNVVS